MKDFDMIINRQNAIDKLKIAMKLKDYNQVSKMRIYVGQCYPRYHDWI